MIEFRKLVIYNFCSVEEFSIEFNSGVYTLLGNNGVGKTSILMALLQGLYNKNIKQEKDIIEETYNKINNTPYKIEITFEKNGDIYKVINDRVKNNITIIRNNININSKGIKAQLQQIQKIIGMDYSVFSAFYYLSTNTLHHIFDITNEQNLVYKFFDIETLNKIEKQFKALLKEYKAELGVLQTSIRSIDRQLQVLEDFTVVDVDALYNRKDILQESLIALEKSEAVSKLRLLEQRLNTVKNKIHDIDLSITEYSSKINVINSQVAKFKTGTCPVCNQSVEDLNHNLEEELNTYKNKKKTLEKSKNNLVDKIKEIKDVYINTKQTYESKKSDIEKELNSVTTQLLLHEKNVDKYQRALDNIDNLNKQKKEFVTKYNDKKDYLIYIETILTIIKSKSILKKYLLTFVKMFNYKLKELIDLIGFDINIVVHEKKGKLAFKFFYDDIEKTINSLSSGEKTRTSLVVLFAMLETLQSISSFKINLLALDEILGVLDKEGVEVLKKLLTHYKKNLAIFLIQHHKEIDSSFFDYTIKLNKKDGITIVEDRNDTK